MKKYKRITIIEREDIMKYLAQNHSLSEIARILQRHPSTIGREVGHSAENYRASDSDKRSCCVAKRPQQRKLDSNEKLCKIVLKYLDKKWSPEQIAKTLKKHYPNDMNMQISHETIYQYIYTYPRGELKKILVKELRREHVNRRAHKLRKKSQPIQDYISIHDRPDEVNERKVFGHWEGDLIMGSRNLSAIGVLVERLSGMVFIVKLVNKDAESVRKAFARKFSRLKSFMKESMTYDHGCEMAEHKLFTQKTKIIVYFADPHSPWQRGTSENTNGLIRQFFPKGTDFTNISAHKLKHVQDLLNDRPRKRYDWCTPREMFNKYCVRN